MSSVVAINQYNMLQLTFHVTVRISGRQIDRLKRAEMIPKRIL